MSILSVLEALAATTSRTEKAAILEGVKGTDIEQTFITAVKYAYSPYIKFNIASEVPRPATNRGDISLEQAWPVLDSIAAREVTGKQAEARMVCLQESLTAEDAEVVRRILLKDLRVGSGASTFNKAWNNIVYEHPYMRCSVLSESNKKKRMYPAFSEIKYDGRYTDVIVTSHGVTYMSRSGLVNEFGTTDRDAALMSYLSHYPDGFVLMGEALVVDRKTGQYMPRATGNGLLESDRILLDDVHFRMWDIVPYPDFMAKICRIPRRERVAMLKSAIDAIAHSGVLIAEIRPVADAEEFFKHLTEAGQRGEEGTIFKNADAIWKDGTSQEQWKAKRSAECEVRITEVFEGKGRLKGKAGALGYSSEDGVITGKTAGLSDKDRARFFKKPETVVGAIASMLFNDITMDSKTQQRTLYLPRISEFRSDKTDADTVERIEEQLESALYVLKNSI